MNFVKKRAGAEMTALLASLSSLEETKEVLAIECGADVLDFKDPTHGALGAWNSGVLDAAVALVAGRKTTSATIGDLPMKPEMLAAAVRRTAESGVDFVKVGFFPQEEGGEAWGSCLRALAVEATRGARIVAVMFADGAPDFTAIESFAANGLVGVMLDTADKKAGGLRSHLGDAALADFVALAREHRLFCGLAGSLGRDDVLPLLALSPDYLGFRGALCGAAGRTGQLDADALRALKDLFQATELGTEPVDGSVAQPSQATAIAGAQVAAISRNAVPSAPGFTSIRSAKLR